jgi:hypothetical protein
MMPDHMAIAEPAAVPSSADGSVATFGILAVTVPTIDGRPAWSRKEIYDAVERFGPGAVAILDGHNRPGAPAPIIGHVSTLEVVPEGLRFGAEVTAAAGARLRARGGHAAISSEQRVAAGSGRHTVTVDLPTVPTGPLVAIAILWDDRPARPSSWIQVVAP